MSLIWLFPGQGSQQVGMGKALCAASSAAREVFSRADRALGWSVSELCFEGPESKLGQTAFTQPAILTVSMAAVAALREAHPELVPAYAAGHSLGEYSALVASGSLALEDAVRLVHTRGRAMQAAVPEGRGGMAAVLGGNREAVLALCQTAAQGDVLAPANFNSPGQVVVAGHTDALARAVQLAPAFQLKARVLKVSAPFHCPLMRAAAVVVDRALSDVSLAAPIFPVVSNVDARANSDPMCARRLLVEQVDRPVLWEQSVRCLIDWGASRALELGPGNVLAGLVKRIDPALDVLGIGEPEGLKRAAGLLGRRLPASDWLAGQSSLQA
ncbi:ACP S-malonyltransferase [Myxococcota bacterium]